MVIYYGDILITIGDSEFPVSFFGYGCSSVAMRYQRSEATLLQQNALQSTTCIGKRQWNVKRAMEILRGCSLFTGGRGSEDFRNLGRKIS